MSLIEEDVIRIKKIADGLGGAPQRPGRVFCPIMTYDFDEPGELKSMLETMWDKLGKEEMKAFSHIITMLAFKNRDMDEEIELSTINYQF